MLTKKGNSEIFKLWVIIFQFYFSTLVGFLVSNYWQLSVTLLSNVGVFEYPSPFMGSDNISDFSHIGYCIAL